MDPRTRTAENRRRRTVRWLATGVVVGSVGLAGIATADHGDDYIDLAALNAVVEHDDAVFVQGGIGAGTGNYDPFLQVHANPVERGYNTEPASNGEFDTKSIAAGNTRRVLASAVPQVTYDGVLYREFGLDANDVGADPYMSVDEIKLFLDDQFALTDYDEGSETFGNDTGPTATKIYDLDANSDTAILVESQTLEPGSGVSDITVLVPASLFPDECQYGSLDCTDYLIFWTVMGALEGDPTDMGRNWSTSDGFEEWQFSKEPVVTVTKTAEVSLTRTHTWDITKTVAPDAHDGFVADGAGTSTWTVVVDETEVDSATTVSGTIEITNPTDPDLGVFEDGVDAVIEAVDDVISVDGAGDTNVTVSCPETFPFTLDPGEVLTCTYSEVVDPGEGTGTNTATVHISDGEDFATSFSDTADVDFADATVTHVGPEEVTVDDDRDTEGNFPTTTTGDATWDYDEDFTCSSDPADYTDGVDVDDHDNTATLADGDEVFDSDDATVTVTCHLPSVAKTAAGTNDETHTWTIDKSPDGDHHLFAGEDVDHDYTIALDETVVEGNFVVTGTVTITNPHPTEAAVVTLADQLDDGTTATFTDCADIDGVADGLQVSVPAAGSLDCAYTAADAGGDATSNTATITLNGIDQSDTEPFTYVPNVVNPQVNVTDDNGTPGDPGDDRSFGPFADDGSDGYTQTFACSSDPDDYTDGTYSTTVVNTATIDETGDSDTATVDVTCYLPGVTKTAAGDYDETHTWEITKDADASYSMVAGDDVDHDYTIAVDETVVDSNFVVTGTVTITNPHPTEAAVVTLADQLDDGTTATFTDCADIDGVADGLQVSVPAAGSLDCAYTAADAGGDATSNTATITLNGIDQSDTEPFTYEANVIGFDAVDVTDDNGTPGDNGDDRSFGPFADDGSDGYTQTFACSSDPDDYTDGTYSTTVVNTATIDQTGQSDTATVDVTCWMPLVDKTTDTSFTRTYNWLIDKDALLADGTSVPAEGLMLNFGQAYDLEWEITVDLDAAAPFTDSGHAIDGIVTVTNPAPGDGPDMTLDVTDVLTPDGGADVPIVVDCDPVADGAQNTGLVLGGGESVDCTYSQDTDGTDGTNVATATLDTGASDSGSADVDFSDASADITEVNATIQVTDTFNGGSEVVLGTAHWTEAPKTFTVFTLLSSDPTDLPDALLECGEQTITNRTDMDNHDDDVLGANLGFDTRDVLVTVTCAQGCTLTQGYWKTHNDSFWGGAPTDETWALIGDVDGDGTDEAEGEEFFGTGMTWFEVMWTSPSGGDAWYQFAHQWVAAHLNTLAGADPSAVQDALDFGWTFFASHGPDGTLKGKDGKFVRQYASLLDDYNNGLIGPGHCDEDGSSLA